jgi:hypothetical protein
MSKNGSLYGTTGSGNGSSQYGNVFELAPPASPGGAWTDTVLHTFDPGNGDGAFPAAGLTIGKSGAIYGATSGGGGPCATTFDNGCGVVFELAPPTGTQGGPWTENLIYSFLGFPHDGAVPSGALVFGANGAIYGTTAGGGNSKCYAGPFGQAPHGCGLAFQLTPPSSSGASWTETILYTFKAAGDGARPLGGVILGPDGTLYGTTSQNGKSPVGKSPCCGTVFALTP